MDEAPDPTTLTDEELNAALTPEPQKEPEAEPELEPEQSETPEKEEPEASGDPEPEPEKTPQPSRREQLRIEQLLEKYGDPEVPKARRVDGALDYEKELDADPETVKRLREDRESFGNQMHQQGLDAAKYIQFHTRLEVDAPRVEARHPELDQHSDDFKPAVASSLNKMYLAAVGYDAKTDTVQRTDIRYSDYVESMFELVDEMASRKVEDTQRNITKQAANTAIRPDGSAPKRMNLNKAPQDMTDEELNAVIARAIPSKK